MDGCRNADMGGITNKYPEINTVIATTFKTGSRIHLQKWVLKLLLSGINCFRTCFNTSQETIALVYHGFRCVISVKQGIQLSPKLPTHIKHFRNSPTGVS